MFLVIAQTHPARSSPSTPEFRWHAVGLWSNTPASHPGCIRVESEYSVMHYSAAEAEWMAAQLLAAAKRAREPIQQDLI